MFIKLVLSVLRKYVDDPGRHLHKIAETMAQQLQNIYALGKRGELFADGSDKPLDAANQIAYIRIAGYIRNKKHNPKGLDQ